MGCFSSELLSLVCKLFSFSLTFDKMTFQSFDKMTFQSCEEQWLIQRLATERSGFTNLPPVYYTGWKASDAITLKKLFKIRLFNYLIVSLILPLQKVRFFFDRGPRRFCCSRTFRSCTFERVAALPFSQTRHRVGIVFYNCFNIFYCSFLS